jgi:tetraacyldisaccharide 4'-kinase
VSPIESALVKIWFPNSNALGFALAVLATVLKAVSLFTGPYLRTKSRRQSVRDTAKLSELGVAVIVVGNIVVGGAGKTPLIIALAKALSAKGKKVGILTSGYGSAAYTKPQIVTRGAVATEIGDETMLVQRKTDLPVATGKNRVQSLAALIETHPELNVILSDDGLQHEALHRDIEIVVFDERFAGNQRLLPAGPLREPLTRLDSVDFVSVPPELNGKISQQLVKSSGKAEAKVFSQAWKTDGFISLADYAKAMTSLISPAEFKASLSAALDGGQIALVAGIANPEKFQASLALMGIHGQLHPLGDHMMASSAQIASFGDQPIIMTEKDAVKYSTEFHQASLKNCWVAVGGVTVDPEFIDLLLAKLNSLPT